MKLRGLFFLISFILLIISCNSDEKNTIANPVEEENTPEENNTPETSFFYNAVDFSYYPSIVKKSLTFYNRKNIAKNPLQILKENDVNTIRLRLWHTPTTDHASFKEVKTLSKELKRLGFKVWLTVHYSDYWADPGKQVIPNAWKNLSFAILKDSVYNYTSKIVSQIHPDLIQIGNEIDPGILLPFGNITTNRNQFLDILKQGINAVRNLNSDIKIMIHKADANNATWFFDIVKPLDYDIIGVSYYPKWHGKSLTDLKNQLVTLNNKYLQKVILAETSYPFTLGWNDNNNNVIGSNSEIIYPEYPASLDGQKAFFSEIKKIVKSLDKGIGVGYWGAEWVAFNGPNATNLGSPYENQALFDFNLKATPALEVFKE